MKLRGSKNEQLKLKKREFMLKKELEKKSERCERKLIVLRQKLIREIKLFQDFERS